MGNTLPFPYLSYRGLQGDVGLYCKEVLERTGSHMRDRRVGGILMMCGNSYQRYLNSAAARKSVTPGASQHFICIVLLGAAAEREQKERVPHPQPKRVLDLKQVLWPWGDMSAFEALPAVALPLCPGLILLPQRLLKCQEVRHLLHCPEAQGAGKCSRALASHVQTSIACTEMNFKSGGEAKIPH